MHGLPFMRCRQRRNTDQPHRRPFSYPEVAARHCLLVSSSGCLLPGRTLHPAGLPPLHALAQFWLPSRPFMFRHRNARLVAARKPSPADGQSQPFLPLLKFILGPRYRTDANANGARKQASRHCVVNPRLRHPSPKAHLRKAEKPRVWRASGVIYPLGGLCRVKSIHPKNPYGPLWTINGEGKTGNLNFMSYWASLKYLKLPNLTLFTL